MKRPANPTVLKLLNPQKKVGLLNRSLMQQQRNQNPFLLTPFSENDYFNSVTMSFISPQIDPYSQKFLSPVFKYAKKSDREAANERISEWQDDVRKYLETHTWDAVIPNLKKVLRPSEDDNTEDLNNGEVKVEDIWKLKEPEFLNELLSKELLEEADSIVEEFPEVKGKVQKFLKSVAQSNIERVKKELRSMPSTLNDARKDKERLVEGVEESVEKYKKAREKLNEGYSEILRQFRGKRNKTLSAKKFDIQSLARRLLNGQIPEKPSKEDLSKYSLEELLAYKDLFDIPSPSAFGDSSSTSKFLKVFYPALTLTSKYVTGLPDLTRNLSEIDGKRILFLYDTESMVTDPQGRVHDEGVSHVDFETPGWQATKHIFRYVGDLMKHHDELRIAKKLVKGEQKKSKVVTDEDVQRMIQEAKDESEFIDNLIRLRRRGKGQLERLADAASTPKIPIRPIF